MNLERLSQRAQAVVHARVDGVDLNEKKVRVASLSVIESVKGPDLGGSLHVELLQRGSKSGGWVERVADAVELRPGEEVLLFLNYSSERQVWLPVGLKQGKFRIVTDDNGVRRALSWRDGAINQVSNDEILSTPTVASRLALMSSAQDLNKVETLSHIINQVRGFAQ